MRPSKTGKRIPALIPTDNCSVADTSMDDRTLTSFIDNAAPTTALSPPEKRPEKRPSRETSPSFKHQGLRTEVVTIENWRPHMSTVTKKSTGSTDSMADRPPKAIEIKAKSTVEPNASDLGSFRRRRPGASYGADALASLKARLVAERDTSDISSAALTTHSESGDLALMRPLEPESDIEVANEFYLRSMSRLPLIFAPDCAQEEDSTCVPRPGDRDRPALENPNTDFSFATQSRLPLYTTLQGSPHTPGPSDPQYPQDTQDPLDYHPEILSLSPTLQSLVRKNMRPEAGEKGRAVAAIILECFSGPRQGDTFELPSKSRVPPYVNVRPRTPRQEAESDDEDLEYAEGTDGSFSFSHRARLPLHMIAGAEVRQIKIKANAKKPRSDNLAPLKTYLGKFEFKQGPSLPSFSSFFKGPIETSTLSTQLARKGVPLQISEAGKKGHIIGSVDSIGEYIRPNANPSFLFSITPFTKSEVQEGKKAKDVLFGKLKKTWQKQEHIEEKTRSNRSSSGTTGTCARASNLHVERGSASTTDRSTQRESTSTSCSTQTAPSSIPYMRAGCAQSALAPPPTGVETTVGTDETLTGDRHRFDALINRLQQKLSERSEQDSKGTTPSFGRTPKHSECSNTGTHLQTRFQARRQERLAAHGSHQNYGTLSSQQNSLTEKQRERLLASTTGFQVSQNREIRSSTKVDGPDSGLKETNLPTLETKGDGGPPMDHKILASAPILKPNTQTLPPTLPPRPKAEPNPYLPAAALNGSSWTSALNPNQPPFHPLTTSFPYPNFPEQRTTVLGMGPQPGVWKPHPPQGPAPASLVPHILAPVPAPVPRPVPAPLPPCPRDTLKRWPMSKRANANRRQRTPFVPLDAADQQKIEEHIELLKSTIPNFATLSKRRQELRWEKQKGKGNRQQADTGCLWTNPYESPRQLQQHQRQQHQQYLHPQQVPPVQPARQLHQMQLHQMQQMQQMRQMRQMQLDQQCYQQGHPVLPTQPMQPYYPYAQCYPNAMGTSTWPMPMMNMTM